MYGPQEKRWRKEIGVSLVSDLSGGEARSSGMPASYARMRERENPQLSSDTMAYLGHAGKEPLMSTEG